MKTIKITMLVLSVMIAGTILAQTKNVNTSKTSIKWTGKKVGGEHYGYISVKEGKLDATSKVINSGEFIIDMASLTCTDLEDAGYNAKLVGHLKSDDFFGVEKFPTAILKINNKATFKKGEAKVKADLTIKGKTHPVEFIAKENKGSYSATIVVDRSKYDVKYGSSSFFDNLGDKVIYDEFTLEVNLVLE